MFPNTGHGDPPAEERGTCFQLSSDLFPGEDWRGRVPFVHMRLPAEKRKEGSRTWSEEARSRETCRFPAPRLNRRSAQHRGKCRSRRETRSFHVAHWAPTPGRLWDQSFCSSGCTAPGCWDKAE